MLFCSPFLAFVTVVLHLQPQLGVTCSNLFQGFRETRWVSHWFRSRIACERTFIAALQQIICTAWWILRLFFGSHSLIEWSCCIRPVMDADFHQLLDPQHVHKWCSRPSQEPRRVAKVLILLPVSYLHYTQHYTWYEWELLTLTHYTHTKLITLVCPDWVVEFQPRSHCERLHYVCKRGAQADYQRAVRGFYIQYQHTTLALFF